MSERKHEPLKSDPDLLSEEKRKWIADRRSGGSLEQPRLAVFQTAMNTTPRPTNPKQSIASGYMHNNKFHDREPEALWNAIKEIDPGFFDTYPRKKGTPVDAAFVKAAIGELARVFYRYGLPAYGKPGLRKTDNSPLRAI